MVWSLVWSSIVHSGTPLARVRAWPAPACELWSPLGRCTCTCTCTSHARPTTTTPPKCLPPLSLCPLVGLSAISTAHNTPHHRRPYIPDPTSHASSSGSSISSAITIPSSSSSSSSRSSLGFRVRAACRSTPSSSGLARAPLLLPPSSPLHSHPQEPASHHALLLLRAPPRSPSCLLVDLGTLRLLPHPGLASILL